MQFPQNIISCSNQLKQPFFINFDLAHTLNISLIIIMLFLLSGEQNKGIRTKVIRHDPEVRTITESPE